MIKVPTGKEKKMIELYGIISLAIVISYLWGGKRKHKNLKSRAVVWFIIVQILFLTCIMPQQLFEVFMIIVGLVGVCEVEYNRPKDKLQWAVHTRISYNNDVAMGNNCKLFLYCWKWWRFTIFCL